MSAFISYARNDSNLSVVKIPNFITQSCSSSCRIQYESLGTQNQIKTKIEKQKLWLNVNFAFCLGFGYRANHIVLYRRIFVYTFCLINICLSLSDDANKIKTEYWKGITVYVFFWKFESNSSNGFGEILF